MTFALLFPGQGAERPGMGLELAARHKGARALLDKASMCTGVDVARAIARGGRELARTEVLQPALVAVALGAHLALCEALDIGCPVLIAGHSLGELSAWCATGAITAADAVELAAERGRLMAREAARRPGGMLALIGPDATSRVEEALALGRRYGAVDVAAYNAPDECVLAGDLAALREVARGVPSTPLAVAGAWHGAAMAGAVEELLRALRSVHAAPARAAFVLGSTGAVALPEAVPALLAQAIARPVRWSAVLSALVAAGVRDVVTVGPGAVLRGLVRKNLGSTVRVLTTEDPDDLGRTRRVLARNA